MKVLLVRHHDTAYVNTRFPVSLNIAQGVYPPLGIAYIAANLEREGYEVEILDSLAENLTTQETKERIRGIEPDVVGVTAMTPTVLGALEVLKLTKEIDKDIITVIGGPQLSVYPEETVSYNFVDYGIIGEGELAMAKLLKDLPNTKVHESIINRDLSDLPLPARHLLPVDKYQCILMKNPMTTMITARGCPFHCSFCFTDKYRQSYRVRTAKDVVDEMEMCVNKYRVKEIGFYDDCFPNRKHLVSICEEIIDRGLKVSWETPQRTDLVDLELLKLMKEAGCIRLRYGVESGNQRILKLMNKGTNLEDIEKVFRWTKDVGIETFAYFMIGYLTGSKDTVQDTIEFAKKLNPDWLIFMVTIPMPMTELMKQSTDIVDPDYWKKFTLGCDNKVPHLVVDADKLCEHAYKEFYIRPSFILKKLAEIRSYDQLKKYVRGTKALLRFRMI